MKAGEQVLFYSLTCVFTSYQPFPGYLKTQKYFEIVRSNNDLY